MRLRLGVSTLIVFTVVLGVSGLSGAAVIKRDVTFDVRNVNGSVVPCATDGARYEIKGTLVGPASKLGPAQDTQHSVTLYLHGFSFGRWFWNLSAVPRYDYAAAQARSGHVSLVIDRLGYGSSGRPEGSQTCLGAAADIAHQIIGRLRSGDYRVAGLEPTRFARVALAGHSTGALIANLEAISFGDVDGLVAMSYTPQVSQSAFEQFYASRVVCNAGGDPRGYVSLAPSAADFGDTVFHSAPTAVKDAVTPLRAPDPCGDGASIIDALVQDLKSLSRVRVPVLVVCGREDAVTPDFACPYLKRRYTGSRDVSLFFVANAGHALPLERAAPTFRRRVSTWLRAHGF